MDAPISGSSFASSSAPSCIAVGGRQVHTLWTNPCTCAHPPLPVAPLHSQHPKVPPPKRGNHANTPWGMAHHVHWQASITLLSLAPTNSHSPPRLEKEDEGLEERCSPTLPESLGIASPVFVAGVPTQTAVGPWFLQPNQSPPDAGFGKCRSGIPGFGPLPILPPDSWR